MDGIAAIHGRIATIEQRFAPAPRAATGAAASPGAVAASGTAPSALGVSPFARPMAAPAGASWSAPTAASFDTVFATAVAEGGALTPALQLAPGAYGRLQPPAELIAYGNGRVPADALRTIGTGEHRLHAPAAQAFQQMEADARLAGVDLGVISSYRDLPTQERLAREKGLYSQGGLAATPGTSNHGWGLSVDLELDGRAQDWMRTNGHRYGFVEDVPREPWHWTYRPIS